MTNTNKKLSLITLLTAAVAFPALATADHDSSGRRTMIGEVGTHTHDAEDFVTVSGRRDIDQLELRATGTPVPLEGVKIQFADGTSHDAGVRKVLRSGNRIVIDVPAHASPIKMLVLDYGNRGPHWRARETARVEIFGLSDGRRDRSDRYDRADWYDDRDDRYDGGYDDRYDRRSRRIQIPVTQPAPVYVQPAPVYVQPAPSAGARFEWRGGVYVRVN